MLIIAGAGTGKTTVITERIIHLIKQRQVPGQQIVALTFTEKATGEMENRLYDRLSFAEASMRVGTFHAFGRTLLEHYAHHLGRNPSARLVKRTEQVVLLTEHLNQLPLALLKPRSDPTGQLNGILNVISRLKNEDVSPERFQSWVAAEQAALEKSPPQDPTEHQARTAELAKHAEVAGCYAAYEELKLQHDLLDYDDQLGLPLKLLREHPDVLAAVRKDYTHVLVDEFQDTNVIQAELAYLVAGDGGNLTVVGDDDQSIYAFRAASLSNVLGFEKRHPQAERVVLKRNYRSSQPILDAAYRLIKHNDPHRLEAIDQFDKHLVANQPEGPPITYWQNATVEDETERVAALLKATKAEGVPYSEMAVLVPTHRDGELFRQTLALAEVPATVERREFLYHQPEIKLAVAALRVLDNPLHSSSLRVVLTSPLYGLPAEDYDKLDRSESRTTLSAWEHLSDPAALAAAGVSGPGQAIAAAASADVAAFRQRGGTLSVGQLLHAYLVEHRGYLSTLETEPLGNTAQINNLSTFFTSLKRFGDVAAENGVAAWLRFFDHIAELKDEAAVEEDFTGEVEAVSILTMHASKGLEFELVVLPVLIADRIPGRRQAGLEPPPELLHDPADRDAHIREQRRLAYVAMTRAKRQLVLSFPNSVGGKRDRLRPSPFIAEALGEQEPLAQQSAGEAAAHRIARLKAPAASPVRYRAPDPLVLNHSSLSAFRECPWRYYWDYHVGVYLPPASQLLYGDAVHNVLRDINRAAMDGQPLDAAAVQARLKQYWRGEGYVSAAERDAAYKDALRTVLSFLEKSAGEPPARAIEEPFKFKLANCFVSGRYDRVDEQGGMVRITDYKTTDAATQAEADKKLKNNPRNRQQLLLYALAHRHTTGKLPDEVALCFPEHYLFASLTPPEKPLATLEEEIQAIAQRIIDGDIRSNPAPHECSRAACNRCPTNTLRNKGDFR